MSVEMVTRLNTEAQQAMTEARAALTEADRPGTTEARKLELDTKYNAAFATAKEKRAKAKQILEMDSIDREISDHTDRPLDMRAQLTPGTGGETIPSIVGAVEARTASGERIFIQQPSVIGSQMAAMGYYEHRGADAELLRNIPAMKPEAQVAYDHYLRQKDIESVEKRALTPYLDPEGGYVISRDMRSELIRQERNLVQIRRYARIIRTNASSVSFPTFKLNMSLDQVRALGLIGKADVRDALGKISFTPSEYAKILQVPEQLLEDTTFPILSYLAEEIALQSTEDEEGLFLKGSGKNEPYGVLTAPIISQSIAGATTAVTPEEIKGFPYNLRAAYRRRGAWMLNRFGIQVISKMRDNIGGPGTGQFLWQFGLSAGDPDTLGGYPVLESEFFPNAFFGTDAVAGSPILLFCDWNQYWIIDRLNLTIKRLEEIYAETSQIGFRYRKRFDGAPVRLEAFARLNRN